MLRVRCRVVPLLLLAACLLVLLDATPLLRLQYGGSGRRFFTMAAAATDAAASADTPGAVWSLHGSGYEHLDCSACLTVAHKLSARMNDSIKRAPRTFLATQRLASGSQRERRAYRDSELRAVEVVDALCEKRNYLYNTLRLNRRTKVRGYHYVFQSNVTSSRRRELREDDVYLADVPPESRPSIAMSPVALLYNGHERSTLSALQARAVSTVCEHLVSEHEDEVMDIIRTATLMSEVEEQLCGLVATGTHDDDSSNSNSNSSKSSKSSKSKPHVVLPVCRDARTLRRAAARDQRRWLLYTQKHGQQQQQQQDANVMAKNETDAAAAVANDDEDAANNTTQQQPPQQHEAEEGDSASTSSHDDGEGDGDSRDATSSSAHESSSSNNGDGGDDL